jgi:hypothetical protein
MVLRITMHPTLDERLSYTWQGNRLMGICRIRAFETALGKVVFLTELANNPGPSVTNAAAEAVQAAAKVLGISEEDTVWLEHYGRSSYLTDWQGKETFARIHLTEGKTATFEHWPESMVQNLLGHGLDD